MPTAEKYFIRPGSLAEAVAALAEPGTMLVGGGTAVTLLLKNRLIEPERLVWIGGLADMSGISVAPDGAITIGATTTLRELHRSDVLRRSDAVLGEAAGKVGNPRVRAVATLGGAVVHGDPRQDLPPVLLAQRARLEVLSRDGGRSIELSAFFLGFMETALGEEEIITSVQIPSRANWHDAYTRFTPGSEDDYPSVGVAVSLALGHNGRIEDAEIALGGVDSTAILVKEAAAALLGTPGSLQDRAAAARFAAAACNPGDDQRGRAQYKRDMVGVWTERTIERCLD